ncbi:ABC-type methionine transport system ATPase subunit [Streptomyces sp. 3330]|nr:ABC-type methionine transport system ATPase subunit [Streptomyces sp. 3330]
MRRRPRQLSGGELQHAALARALLTRPRFLICDEIISSLDTITRREILNILTALLQDRDDLSFVLIAHDLDTALAHRIAVVDAGELIEQGRPPRDTITPPVSDILAAPRRSTRCQRQPCTDKALSPTSASCAVGVVMDPGQSSQVEALPGAGYRHIG